MRVSAFHEALDRFDHGLALVAGLRPSPERMEVEGLLEVARLGPLRNLQGIAGAGLQDALARATRAWSEAPGGGAPGRTRLLLLRAEAERLLVTGQLTEGLAAAEQMRAEATQGGEEDFVALAQLYAGITHHFMGHPQESERHLDALLGWLTPDRQAGLRAVLGIDQLANALAYSALDFWFMGSPEAALTRSRQALDGTRAAGATVGQAAAAALGANLLYFLRVDERVMAEQSEQCYRLSLEHGIGMWQALAEVLLGRLAVMRGELAGAAGIERIRSAMARWQAMGLAIGVDFFVVVLADSCFLAAGRLRSGDDPTPQRSGDDDGDDAARLLATGLAAIEGILGPVRKQCWQAYEAELHRLHGELLLARDGPAAVGEALACFTKSLQLGRAQGALAWELRAAMSLVRLRERQHDPRSAAPWASEGRLAELAEARACLREVYARFTEGFAFPDLQDAAALLGGAADSCDFNAARPGAGAVGVAR
jgi:hypothetical protein